MTRRLLLDTNILIYYFNGELPVQAIVETIIAGEATGFYSPISWPELLCYPQLTDAEATQMRQFLRLLIQVELSEAVLDRSAIFRRDYRIPLPDAIIAACAVEQHCALVTRNVTDFRRVPDLDVINPFEP
jgi:predicted nucleic acid-binding protein